MRTFFSIATLALAASASSAHATTLPDAIPPEVFASLPTFDEPSLSPDGTKIAAKVAVNGRQSLVVVPLFGGSKAVLSDDGTLDINWWKWVNDDWLVVGIGDDKVVHSREFYVTRIIGLSSDMSHSQIVGANRLGVEADDVIWIAHDGSPRLLLSKETGIDDEMEWYPSVFDVDVSTGHETLVVPSMQNVWDWAADASGTVRYGVMWDDGQRSGIVYRPSAGTRFGLVPLGKRKVADVAEPVAFRADGTALAIDDSDGHDSLYELALPSFTNGRKIFGDARYDLDGVALNEAGTDALGVSYVERKPRMKWFDPELDDIQSALDKTLGAGNNRIISWSRDRQKLLIEVGDASQAGALYYWDTNGADLQRVAWNNDALKDRQLSPVTTVEYKARDGTQIEAVLTLPRGRDAHALPLIVMPHGGPGARDDEEYDWWAQYLAERGYAVVQPNYRGSTGYGSAFLDLGKGEWGLKMQDDLIDSIDFLAKQGTIDPKKVCIVGGSYGGYAAMRGAQRDSAHYRCAASFAGISDLNMMLKYDKNTLGKDAVEYWKEQAPDFTSVSPRFHADEFGTPILIVHGAADKRVPIKQSRMLADELRKAGKPYEYFEEKLGDHHLSRAEDRLDFLKQLTAFLDKYNPA